jgi:hypothetical protein
MCRTDEHPEFGGLTILHQAAYMNFLKQAQLPEIEHCAREFSPY